MGSTMTNASNRAIVVTLLLAASAFVAGRAHADGAAALRARYCENDK